jgi:hypothetical protein
LNYIKRSGFDTFVVKEGKDIQEAAAGLGDFTHPYQASTAVPSIIKLVLDCFFSSDFELKPNCSAFLWIIGRIIK